MGRIIRILALALGLFGALLGSQTPEFAQQYRQRLGGRVDELKRSVSGFEQEAKKQKKTPQQALEILISAQDPIIKARGEAMMEDQRRFAHYSRQLEDMKQAGPFLRIVHMFRGIDNVTASAVLDNYEPAVPVTSEGFVMAGAGFLLFSWLVMFVNRIIKRLFALLKSRKKQSNLSVQSGAMRNGPVKKFKGAENLENRKKRYILPSSDS